MGLLDRLRRKEEAPEIAEDPVEHAAAIIRSGEVESMRSEASLPDMDRDGNDPMAGVAYARVIQRGDHYGYELCVGGVPVVIQEYHPEKEGDAPMTEDEARGMAAKALAAYTAVI